MDSLMLCEFFASLSSQYVFKQEYPWMGLKKMHGSTKSTAVGLSNVVLEITQNESLEYMIETHNVIFNKRIENAVSTRLPRGIGRHDPAMFMVTKTIQWSCYKVIACYVDWSNPIVLWQQTFRPIWLGELQTLAK